MAVEKVYYAHAMCMYRWPVEAQHIQTIRRRFKGRRIVNPARYDQHPEKMRDGVAFCLRLIDQCDIVVFCRLLNRITAGVGKEVNHALRSGKPVFELNGTGLVRRSRTVRYIGRRATVRLYEKWRRRNLDW